MGFPLADEIGTVHEDHDGNSVACGAGWWLLGGLTAPGLAVQRLALLVSLWHNTRLYRAANFVPIF